MGTIETPIDLAAASPEEKCTIGVAMVVEQLGDSKEVIDKRAVEYAGFIVNGFVAGHFKPRPKNPNPVHARIYDILETAGIVPTLLD